MPAASERDSTVPGARSVDSAAPATGSIVILIVTVKLDSMYSQC